MTLPAKIVKDVRSDLGRAFEFHGPLGRGSTSLTYRARDREHDRLVALKVYPLLPTFGPDAADRFQGQFLRSAQLQHPAIVPLYRCGITPNLVWYTMQYVDGLSLGESVRDNGSLHVPTCIRLVRQIGVALSHAHREGVIHGDIRPGNVQLNAAGTAFVTDFGIAQSLRPVAHAWDEAPVIGSPEHAAPEQFTELRADERTDQYSLAVLAYECLSGTTPFAGDSIEEVITKHQAEKPIRLSDQHPDIPEQVSRALGRALSLKPEDRFDSIEEFVAAFTDPATAGVSAPAVADEERILPRVLLIDPVGPIRWWRRPSAMLAGVVLTLLGAAGGWWLATRQETRSRVGTSSAALVQPVHRESINQPGAPVTTSVPTSPPAPRAPQPAAAARGPERVEELPSARPTAAPSDAPLIVPGPPGRLFVSTTPWGDLYLDEELVGATPIVNHEIPPGLHRVVVVRSGFTPFDTTLQVAPGRQVRLTNIALRPSDR